MSLVNFIFTARHATGKRILLSIDQFSGPGGAIVPVCVCMCRFVFG